MKKTFKIHHFDAGSEAFCNDYVKQLESENARLHDAITRIKTEVSKLSPQLLLAGVKKILDEVKNE